MSTKTVSVTLLRSALMAQKPDAKIAATILSWLTPCLRGLKPYHRGPLRGQGTSLAALCRLWPHTLLYAASAVAVLTAFLCAP